jgi:hypothetical protein
MTPTTIPPAGVSEASFFTPATFTPPARPPAILALKLDATTGEILSFTAGGHPVDNHVLMAIRVQRDSGPSVGGIGNRLVDIRKVDDTTAMRVKQELNRCLEPLVQRLDIRIEKLTVDADPNGDTAQAFIEYTNLQNQIIKKITLNL